MTEAEWLASEDEDPFRVLFFMPKSDRVCARTVLLFCAAYGRAAVQFLPPEPSLQLPDTGEQVGPFYDSPDPNESEHTAGDRDPRLQLSVSKLQLLARAATVNEAVMIWRRGKASDIGCGDAVWQAEECIRRTTSASLRRCIFGNPFHPVTFDPAWRTSTAISLAADVYESRDFGAMPVLADALQDAGCESVEVLDHCRSSGPHARGCWVVDSVLGKE